MGVAVGFFSQMNALIALVFLFHLSFRFLFFVCLRSLWRRGHSSHYIHYCLSSSGTTKPESKNRKSKQSTQLNSDRVIFTLKKNNKKRRYHFRYRRMKTEPEDYSEVCDNEANSWRICVEKNLGGMEIRRACEPHKETFDKCIASWRAKVGPSVQVKGENEGEPPLQCAAMSCLVGECLRQFNYDFQRCKPPMDFFKHCVQGLYGSQYID